MTTTVRALGRGTLTGALVCFFGQALSLAPALLVTSRDEATRRAVEAVSLLGDERWLFIAKLVGSVTLAGALLGFAQALLRVIAWPERPEHEHAKSSVFRDVAAVTWVLLVLVFAKASEAPALVVPSLSLLPGAARVVRVTAAYVPPDFFYGVFVFATLAALGRGLYVRRRAALAAAASASGALGVFVVLACLCGAAPSENAAAPNAQAKPNVLILAADSIRADHLSALGYPRATTPNLDKLAREGVLFERAMAPLAMTTPSWVSILTGRYPHGHGIRHMFPDRALRPRSLDALPKVAAENGYRTRVISDYAGDFFPLFDFGFSEAQTSPPLTTRVVFQREVLVRSPLAIALLESLPERFRPSAFRYLMNAADANRLASEAIDSLDGDERPFFTVVFFSTTHVPFASRYPYFKRFAAPENGGEHAFAYNLMSLADIARAETPLAPAEAAHIVGLYDGALASVDSAVGDILEALSARHLEKNTLVLFLSDHGENLFEPGQTTLHGKWFRGGDQANRVPLIVRGPGLVTAAGARVKQPVSLVDVAPTLTDILGWRPVGDSASVEGRSLAPALRGERLVPRAVFAETGAWLGYAPDAERLPTPAMFELLTTDPSENGQIVAKLRYEDAIVQAKHRAVWLGDRKLVYEPTRQSANVHLFDMSADPWQRRDLAPLQPQETGFMMQRLLEWLERDTEREVDARLHVVRRDG